MIFMRNYASQRIEPAKTPSDCGYAQTVGDLVGPIRCDGQFLVIWFSINKYWQILMRIGIEKIFSSLKR